MGPSKIIKFFDMESAVVILIRAKLLVISNVAIINY